MNQETNIDGQFDFSQLGAEIASSAKDDAAAMREYYDHMQLLENEHFHHPDNEFAIADEHEFEKAVKTLILARNLSPRMNVSSRSAKRMKKAMQAAISIGVISQYFNTVLLAYTQKPRIAVSDELFAEASRMYIGNPAIYSRKIYLRKNGKGPYGQFAKVIYKDRNGTTVPVADWAFVIVDGNHAYEILLALEGGPGSMPEYFSELAFRADIDRWTTELMYSQ